MSGKSGFKRLSKGIHGGLLISEKNSVTFYPQIRYASKRPWQIHKTAPFDQVFTL